LEKKSAISISLSVFSHYETGKQFNPMKITFIVFPIKERSFSGHLQIHILFPGNRAFTQNLYGFNQTPDRCL
jgi:hypothetical protein